MRIYCNNTHEFYTAIEECVKRGLTFEANVQSLTIQLMGGF
jgi:hypothetical protein